MKKTTKARIWFGIVAVVLVAGIAASVMFVFGLTWFLIGQHTFSEDCVAYVHGQRVDDPNRVIALMQGNLQEMNLDASDDPVENQLRDMFETLK